MGPPRVHQGSTKGPPRVHQGSTKGPWWTLGGPFKNLLLAAVACMFSIFGPWWTLGGPLVDPWGPRIQGSTKGPPRIHQRSTKGPPRVHQGSTKGPPRVH